MINLDDNKYITKKLATTEDILAKVSDFNIYKYYCPELYIGCKIKSPFHKDSNPSLTLFYSNKYNKIFFKDFGGEGLRGDVIVFLMNYLDLNYGEVLQRIVTDFRLDDYFVTSETNLRPVRLPIIHSKEYIDKAVKESVSLEVKFRDWNDNDRKYWTSFGICKYTLERYRVKPISHIFLGEQIIIADKLAYAYIELKDDVVRYKIYQPMSKTLKWLNNMVEGTLSGWSQLDDTGEMLIIASSLKDAMTIHDLGFNNVIAPQTENYIHKQHIIDHLKSRFKKIYIFYDNDKPGIDASKRICDMYDLKALFTGVKELKDPSDFYRSSGDEELYTLIHEQL